MKLTTLFVACLIATFCVLTGQVYSHGLSWDTPVKIWNGSKNIYDVAKKPSKNKKVVSYTFRKNRCTSGYIKSSGKSQTNCYMRIGFGNDFLNSGHDDLLCTPAQEFYLPNSNNWVPACQLKVGDVLKSDSVGSVAIMRIEFVNQPLTVYTLEVSKYHNFFVGKYFVLTHNMALPWEVTLGFSIPFGSACTGGRLGGFFGPVGIVGGAVIGGLVGLLAEKIINKDKVQEYVAYFDTELVGGWIKANDGRKRSLGPTQGGGSQLPNDPNNKKEPDWTPHQYKHFPKKNTIWKDTIKSTRSPNAAKYKPDINIKELEYQAWKEGTSVHGKSFKVFKADKVIGASTGTEIYCMKVKISSNVIHGHPITLAEYLNCIK